MQRLEVSGVVRLVYKSLGVKRLITTGIKSVFVAKRTNIDLLIFLITATNCESTWQNILVQSISDPRQADNSEVTSCKKQHICSRAIYDSELLV